MNADQSEYLSTSGGQNLAQIAGNYLFDGSIDTGVAGTPVIGGPLIHDFGRGNPMYLVFVVTTTFTSGGAATVQLQHVSATDAALTGTLTVIRQTDAIGYASLTAGVIVALKLGPVAQRYTGARAVIGGATTTAGKMACFLSTHIPSNGQFAVL